MLNHVWELIHPDDDVPALVNLPGAMVHATTAVVTLSEPCTRILPVLATIRDAARSSLGARLVEGVKGDLKFRLEIPLRIAAGGMTLDRSIVIEPRFTATSADRIHYTSSPLTSVQHFAMLESIEEVAGRA